MPVVATFRTLTHSEDETVREGAKLAGQLAAGEIVALCGTLGAGKTTFVRGIATGFGLDPRSVHSPSFAILTEYGPAPSGRRLVHVDLYRVEDPAEVEELGLVDYLQGDCVMAVEWSERLPGRLLRGAVRVTIEDAGEDERRVTIAPDDAG